ncbi:MAG: hypothetical protein HXL68_14675 [Dechloromonas agitata]|uniref:Uncharacterized protein n=1 Tax=Dechloromonas agitata TaxID=73030 RepID=A0A930BYW8_9RHOO|nr:hypothetical protein [Dechloromonas agitata]
MAVGQGRLAADALSPGTDWPPLHDSYGQVMKRLYEPLGPADGSCCAHAAGDEEPDASR